MQGSLSLAIWKLRLTVSLKDVPYFQKEVIRGRNGLACAILEVRIDVQTAPLWLYKPWISSLILS